MLQVIQEIHSKAVEGQQYSKKLRRKLADMTNAQGSEDESTRNRKKKREDTTQDAERTEVRQASQCLTVNYTMWAPGRSVWRTKLQADYNPLERFETTNDQAQGFLQDIIHLLPNEMANLVKSKERLPNWIVDIVSCLYKLCKSSI
jgi:hypothetical protein